MATICCKEVRVALDAHSIWDVIRDIGNAHQTYCQTTFAPLWRGLMEAGAAAMKATLEGTASPT